MNRLLAGCGGYVQGKGALLEVVPALRAKGLTRALTLAGPRAFAAVRDPLWLLLSPLAGDEPVFCEGCCTDAAVAHHTALAREAGADCVVGIGGGRVLDIAKAVADEAHLPVFTVPTIAATCAAYAPLSVMYRADGAHQGIRFFTHEVDGVFTDTDVIARAPARYLAAGLADAMAKACEYASMTQPDQVSALPLGKYLGLRLAQAEDERLEACALDAVESARRGEITPALDDAVCCAIACTGVVSGLGGYGGRGGARFAIAHAVNEALRGVWFPPEQWLHGEAVAVGVLAQMTANGADEPTVARRRELLVAMDVPVRLSQLSPALAGPDFERFADQVLAHVQVNDAQRETVLHALQTVR
ncbi:MAG: iron-containing alcohol dehydrogenase family protein [Clostridiales bacterium]|nr:iron-containing alcohol dehydrogenase family protein [Clostridiales bacterium]